MELESHEHLDSCVQVNREDAEACQRRGYHDDEELIDPKGGGFVRCRKCGRELDMEDPDGDLAIW